MSCRWVNCVPVSLLYIDLSAILFPVSISIFLGLTSETAERLAAHDTLQIPTLSGVEGSGASPASPLHVTLSNSGSGWKNQAWKTLRSVLIAFLGITALATLFESGSLGGKMGLPQTAQLAEESDKSFKDVVGVDEAKAELEEIVLYLRDPSRFTRLGGKLPKGLLLLGAPGTGKTLLARAIAGEAGVPFYYTSGSAFEEMFVGVGARRVRDLFNEAKKRAPCIVFIDEIDAIGGSRQLREQQNMKMTLNQLLVEMDGFEENNGVIVIAATNFPEGLDKALVRPGRFDKRVAVPLPDVKGRRQILTLYGSQVSLRDDVNLDQLARGTPGFSGADLCNIVNQAAVKASMDGLSFVTTSTLEWAKDKILMGSERKSALIDPKTKKCTAYHEGGHALIAVKSLSAEPVHKATILPRGNALGMVVQLPEGDQTSYTRVQLMAKLDVLMGGRVAEELLFGDMGYSTGPSNDLEQATKLARMMVSQWGMSDKLGLVSHKDSTETSEAYKRIVDEEIQKLVTESYERAKGIITTHRKDLDRLANALLEHETLTGEEVCVPFFCSASTTFEFYHWITCHLKFEVGF